ncbi:MAG: hypothetical protein AB1758_32160 [Candidatus Eremiobacterota bacterium]
MTDDLLLRRKWTLRAHGRSHVFTKRSNERSVHVVMKALLWALYLPGYPDLAVETAVGHRYKPDVVSLDPQGKPRFWGEAGHVGIQKIRHLVGRFRATHLALARWHAPMRPFEAMVREELHGVVRTAPVDLVCFAPDAAERFIDPDGRVSVRFEEVEWVRLAGGTP